MGDEIQRWSATGEEGSVSVPAPIEAGIELFLRSSIAGAITAPIRPPDDHGAFPIAEWPMLGYLVPPIVVDANVLRNDILYSCRNDRRTSLVVATNAGFLRMFCAEHVIEEVDEHSQRWAREGGIDGALFLDRWQGEYLPLLRCVDVPSGLLTESEAQAIARLERIDPDDVPSATLARLLGAFYLSEDKKALEAVYGPELDFEIHHAWVDAIRYGSNSAQIKGASQVALIAPALLGQGLFGAGRFLYYKSPWLLAGTILVIGSFGYLAWRSEQDKVKGALASLGDGLLAIGKTVTAFRNYALQSQAAFSRVFPIVPNWQDMLGSHGGEQVLARHCLHSLAREPRGHLSAAEMYEGLPLYVTGQQNTVRKVLREYPCFQEVGRGRWQVGRGNSIHNLKGF
ncbi:PIN domain-containing protein [Ferrimicrobium sp.]|uniref:PIN domain-containing protein n=1 Tax=Ferrimicrobium sp. TaxID=2926050 RepID=UPI002620AECE|nr:PIN domain-containing protein [Ferrimicrobium sp.]